LAVDAMSGKNTLEVEIENRFRPARRHSAGREEIKRK
jgi:hypothetical protein